MTPRTKNKLRRVHIKFIGEIEDLKKQLKEKGVYATDTDVTHWFVRHRLFNKIKQETGEKIYEIKK